MHRRNETTKMHRRNETTKMHRRNETTKMHRRNEVVDMLDVGGCDLDYLLQGIGQLEKLFHLDLKNKKGLVQLP